ncbi:MAG: LysR family transcriptional regulator [Gammaproteobacteria bacterium]|nr:LysR family transcriptional regulator [Gammaproteobacteria bacterium]
MKDIDTLRLFLAVAEEGSFARAAQRQHLSAAVATRRIAALEAEFGVRLFSRSTRHVGATPEGLLLVEHARGIVAAADAASEALQTSDAAPSGHLRVLARAGLGRHIVVPYLGEFRARYPAVTISLELTEARVLDLHARGCDVGVTIGHLDDSGLVARRLVETDSLLCASPDYLARRGVPRLPDDLSHHDCLTIQAADAAATWHFSREAERFSVRFQAPVSISDADALLGCARAGLGIVMVADWLAADDFTRGSLVRVLPGFQVEPRGTPINALYPSRAYLPRKARAFVEFLVEKCAARFAGLARSPA